MEFPDVFDIPFIHICENSWDISVIFFLRWKDVSFKSFIKNRSYTNFGIAEQVGLHMYEFCRFFLGVIFIYARALVASQIELSKWLLIDNGATVCVRIYAKMIRNKAKKTLFISMQMIPY